MRGLIIREAKLTDAKNIAKVHVKTWQQAYRRQIEDDFLNKLSVEKRTKAWEDNIANSKINQKTFVAERNGKILGFVAVGPCRDKDAKKEWGELYAIYVDQRYASKGIGTMLTQKGLDFLKEQGFKEVTLWVLTTNIKGRLFYESKGWKTEGKTKRGRIGRAQVKEIRYCVSL